MTPKIPLPDFLHNYFENKDAELTNRKAAVENQLESIKQQIIDCKIKSMKCRNDFFAVYKKDKNNWIEQPNGGSEFLLKSLAQDTPFYTLYCLPCRVFLNGQFVDGYDWSYCIGNRGNGNGNDFYFLYKTVDKSPQTITTLFNWIEYEVERSRMLLNYIRECGVLGVPLCQQTMLNIVDFSKKPADAL